jgi:hypothetical protein
MLRHLIRMPSFITTKRLLAVLGILLAARFFLIPLLAWQVEQVESISAKSRQVKKIDALVEFGNGSADSAEELRKEIQSMQQRMLNDSDSAKLSVQQFISNVFASNDMTVTTFEWIADESDDDRLRSLRARVRFSGSVQSMIRSFAGISLATKTLKIIEWDQRFMQTMRGTLGTTRGSVVLHIPLLKRPMVFADPATEAAAIGAVNE